MERFSGHQWKFLSLYVDEMLCWRECGKVGVHSGTAKTEHLKACRPNVLVTYVEPAGPIVSLLIFICLFMMHSIIFIQHLDFRFCPEMYRSLQDKIKHCKTITKISGSNVRFGQKSTQLNNL